MGFLFSSSVIFPLVQSLTFDIIDSSRGASMSLRHSFLVLCFFLGVSEFSWGRIVPSDEYGYAEPDGNLSTIASTVIMPQFFRHVDLKLKVKPKKTPQFSRDSRLKIRYYPAPVGVEAKLVFVVSGLGGDEMSNLSNFLAAKARSEGNAAVIVPNTLTKNFSISSSRTGLVGTAERDSRDLYEVLKLIRVRLAKDGAVFRYTKIVGYSHGALLAAFIDRMESQEGALDLDGTLLLNPPVDLLFGVRTLDRFSRQFKQISLPRLVKVGVNVFRDILHYKKIPTTKLSHAGFLRRLHLTSKESEAIIGKALMSGLGETILASQYVTDLHILPEGDEAQTDSEILRLRSRFTNRISFEGYVEKFFEAFARSRGEQFSLTTLNEQNSLTGLESYLRSQERVRIIHNANDFLLREHDVEWIESVFGDRAVIFPRGGHLGNLWYPDNQEIISKWLNQ